MRRFGAGGDWGWGVLLLGRVTGAWAASAAELVARLLALLWPECGEGPGPSGWAWLFFGAGFARSPPPFPDLPE